MTPIKTNIFYHDLNERLGYFVSANGVPASMERRLRSDGRIYSAMSEAVRAFMAQKGVPVNAIGAYIPTKLFLLQQAEHSGYTGVTAWEWPAPAHKARQDGGVLRLFVSGRSVDAELLTHPRLIDSRIRALQQESRSNLLYGKSSPRAVADFVSNRIYTPPNVTVEAQIIEQPEPIATRALAYGRDEITVTTGAAAAGDIVITNSTFGGGMDVAVSAGDSPRDVARKIHEEQKRRSSTTYRTTLFTDDVRFATKDVGPAAFTALEIDPAATGVEFSKTELVLEPKKSEEIPIDDGFQDKLVRLAFEHIVGSVAGFGGRQEQETERVDEEADTDGE